MFSWRPIYEETASRLLSFEHDQEALIAILKQMEAAGLNIVPLEDKDSEAIRVPLAEIDPFTFMAVFNRPTTFRNKINSWEFLKKAWGLKSEVPRDVQGIPTITPQNAWFFPWKYRRNAEDIPNLWKLARHAIEGRWSEMPTRIFDDCLSIHAVGVAKLTTGLFWIAPTTCLPLPATTLDYLKSKSIPSNVAKKADYDRVMNQVRAELSGDFIDVSHEAWLQSAGYEPVVLTDEMAERLWKTFRAAMPEFLDFANPGATFAKNETDYKRAGLKKFEEAGGRAKIVQLVESGQSPEALKIFQRTVALNIASYQSWRLSVGENDPVAVSDVLGAFLEVTKEPYQGIPTLMPVFDALQRHDLTPSWDTMSVLLWSLRPSDYFPIKISYYRKLTEALGIELVTGRPSAEAFEDVMSFGRAFWKVAERGNPKDWVDVQSFIWVLCQGYTQSAGATEESPAVPDSTVHTCKIWTIAPGERARLWEEFLKAGIIGIGWDHLEDLSLYKSRDEIEQRIKELDQSDGRRSNDALACWEFAHEMEIGDVVIAKKGREQFSGVGVIRGKYRFDSSRGEYMHVRDVEWRYQGLWNVESQFAMKTMTNVTKFPDFVRGLLETAGANDLIEELYGIQKRVVPIAEKPVQTSKAFTMESALEDLFMTPEMLSDIMQQLRRKHNLVLQGPPGVGKTFAARRLAYLLLGEKDDTRIETVQFHPSTSYEDFVLGLRPSLDGRFILKPGIFHRFCSKAQSDPLGRPHIFIIDEINRGNLAKIFGELLMLVESDKRGAEHAVSLTYDNESSPRFFLPKNVYIIGTMNTADRSLALVDYALRRRFAFINLAPNFNDRFRHQLSSRGISNEFVEQLCTRIAALNEKISADTRSLGPGYQIGHSYFCDTAQVANPNVWLREILRFEIQPLLEEYWMDDLKKAADEAALLAI